MRVWNKKVTTKPNFSTAGDSEITRKSFRGLDHFDYRLNGGKKKLAGGQALSSCHHLPPWDFITIGRSLKVDLHYCPRRKHGRSVPVPLFQSGSVSVLSLSIRCLSASIRSTIDFPCLYRPDRHQQTSFSRSMAVIYLSTRNINDNKNGDASVECLAALQNPTLLYSATQSALDVGGRGGLHREHYRLYGA
ncbi:hypothetical protein MVEN_02292800 [Mycena venus]|uniref:Uncharacterized protein n=1 Tax=Mycena venus TaxID=2733690 RepID=A0A8H6X5R7_9AGAR|nr:hypothetical protein MVEN_02292800 [Mycena venus]